MTRRGAPRPAPRARALQTVVDACFADVAEAFGWAAARPGRRLIEAVLGARVHRAARRMLLFDARVGDESLAAGGRYALRFLVRDTRVHGTANVPRQGPLLLVSNHPGLSDAAMLFAALARDDLRVIAARRRLLTALPATSQRMFLVPEAAADRLSFVRRAAGYMRGGGAVLSYPAGRIEPDPAARDGAMDALDHWSASADVFARLVSELTIVPVLVSGVLADAARHHPLVRVRRAQADREWLAATLQFLVPELADTTVEIVFGPPVRANMAHPGRSVGAVVTNEMRRMIRACEARRAPER